MLSVITGRQRSGKSYYCVSLMADYLQKTNRPIYTNIPVNPDALANYACKGKSRYPAAYEAYLKRIHVFKGLSTRKERKEYLYFVKKNPEFRIMQRLMFKVGKNLILEQKFIKKFWMITDANAVIFLDELYQWFPSGGGMGLSPEEKELRSQLLTYTRQHGHFKDDMFLVSHSKDDLDPHIRRGIQRLITVENMKYKNIFDSELLRGLKWPLQFFSVKFFEYGEKKASDGFIYFPTPQVFKCYDSFSVAETLGKGAASADAENTDSGVNNKENVKNFLSQIMPLFTVGVVILGIGVLLFYLFKDTLFKSSACIPLGPKNVSEVDKKIKELPEFHKVKFISSTNIVFDDGENLQIGDFIHGCKVVSFKRRFCLVSRSDKLYRVPYDGLRIRRKIEQRKESGDGKENSRYNKISSR